jgi:hypothetical protein
MMLKFLSASAAAAALLLFGILLASGPNASSPASAATSSPSPSPSASPNVTDDALVCDRAGTSTATFTSASASFNLICLTSGDVHNAGTAIGRDAYDGFGLVTTNDGGGQYVLTADEGTASNDGITFTYVDENVYNSLTGGLVDVHVVRTFIGNTATWNVTVFEAGTDIPAGLYLEIRGNIGSGHTWEYLSQDWFNPLAASYGSGSNYPVLFWKSSPAMTWYNDATGDLSFDFGQTSAATVSNIIVGYSSCTNSSPDELLAEVAADWESYVNTSMADREAHCFDVNGTTTFTRDFAVDSSLTFEDLGAYIDLTDGASIILGDRLPAGLAYSISNENTPGVMPTVNIFGTPTSAVTLNTFVQIRPAMGASPDVAASIMLTVDTAGTTALALGADIGEPVAGSEFSYRADDLQDGAAYEFILRSTPQLLKSGTVPAGNTINGSVAIPSGLEAGWHSITLNSTDYRGAAVSRAMYFKISPSGLLLASNFTGIPAGELAATGSTDNNGALWVIAISLASLGALLMVVALRRKSRSRRTK